jgi:hypothetical protein
MEDNPRLHADLDYPLGHKEQLDSEKLSRRWQVEQSCSNRMKLQPRDALPFFS